jgi:hypothetical protein
MGLFDRFTNRKGEKETVPAEKPAVSLSPPASDPSPSVPPRHPAPVVGETSVLGRLQAAREKLEGKDLPGATAIYEEVLASSGDRADVLVTISGDLGSLGHVRPIIELVAPRYIADRHGAAPGFNLLQAYIAVRDPVPAQHLLDILFSLQRPELEERLYGFSNAVSDLMLNASLPTEASATGATGNHQARKASLVTISKPIWYYGLEPLAAQILPPKAGKLRRVSFAQLALPGGYPDFTEAMGRPEDELGRLSRALPAWLAETFYFSPAYEANVAVACEQNEAGKPQRPLLFGNEWDTETLRQLVESTSEGIDYVFTGSLRQRSGDFEASFRLWEVKKFRERKQFLARWNPATADAELTKLRSAIAQFMEWAPYPAGAGGVAYVPPASARAWVDSLGASLGLFLAGKGICPTALLAPLEPLAAELAGLAPTSETASLAWLTLTRRCRELGLPLPTATAALSASAAVEQAQQLA